MDNRLYHNDFLIKVMGDQKHLKHVLTQPMIDKMCRIEARYPLAKLPVCGHCERLGMWGKGGICHCLKCGTITTKPVTLAEYYAAGYDMDGATGEDRSQVMHEKIARNIILPDKVKV